MEEGKEDRLQFNHLCTATKKSNEFAKTGILIAFLLII